MSKDTHPAVDLAAVAGALEQAGVGGFGLRVLPATGSTNDDLAALAREGAPDRTVLVADLQTGGRGRLGRQWEAPAGSSLAVSVLVRPALPVERWGWLPLLAGVAAVDAVAAVGVRAELKWPNDVRVGDRKLGGLLAEVVQPDGVVLGIGLNTTMREDELPVPDATSLLLAGAERAERGPVLGALLVELDRRLRALEEAGGDPAASGLAAAYAERCGTLGRHVSLELPGGEVVEGVADAVDDQGGLVVGGRSFSAGDVTHLR
ncbi:BirA family biotin operon repressor/biotin-[acetyl-CoA-carboxylase] ligase [Motilibacter rhizosphaerae]|uniref:biotin--[biotin carboxyl-carrier protein] ligase n=1 Tax=Motilibacter rhizosphaerae TaxID=598652 RepID=A0A4Q7NTA8_9ACTN|nr:biotin--[acetyl-CoA-carboxylase] ligase [Motilibacter rhizosphaerae]RZS90234.1 BirA family biotin operon repressor/biotin-[acetyl-CoA-carboxylase] ligase [Motilibacter rhizosphaerae]